jgi:glucose-6-phosphate 1-dehydrogenase
MSDFHSDALVFFGATGDLAYKKIFPALQAMLKRGHLNIPVIGVAKSGWNLDQFRERAQESVEQHGAESPPPRTFATKPSYRRRPFEYFDHTLCRFGRQWLIEQSISRARTRQWWNTPNAIEV